MAKFSIKNLASHHEKMDRYIYLLIALIMLIIAPPIMSVLTIGLFDIDLNQTMLDITYSCVLLASIYITTRNRKSLIIGLFLGGLAFILYWIQFRQHRLDHLHVTQTIVAIVFFGYIGYHLARGLIDSETVTVNTIIGATVGYFLIGVIGGQCFGLIDNFVEDAFAGEMIQTTYDYFYFSFISLTTIGYGDIAPKAPAAKSIAMLLGLIGQIYLTCIIAILVGKYLANK